MPSNGNCLLPGVDVHDGCGLSALHESRICPLYYKGCQDIRLSPRKLWLKKSWLLALSSLKRVGDLRVLSFSLSCLDFAPGLVKVQLRPRPDYVPKVASNPFCFQKVVLEALSPTEVGKRKSKPFSCEGTEDFKMIVQPDGVSPTSSSSILGVK